MAYVKYFIGIISGNVDAIQDFVLQIPFPFNQIQKQSNTLDFNFTNYYKDELGSPLYKKFFLIADIYPEYELSNLKSICCQIEKKTSLGNKRIVNIDPGYINDGSVVLASTKYAPHRIYIGLSIYAEITLYWYKKGYESLPWTYPDFRTDCYKQFFLDSRKIFLYEKRHNF
jgi:hypothetical protein